MRKLWGFILYGFPEENSLCLLSLVFIVVHVILSDKILRSYCLNDKNIALLAEGIQPVRTGCVLVLQEKCEINYYGIVMPG